MTSIMSVGEALLWGSWFVLFTLIFPDLSISLDGSKSNGPARKQGKRVFERNSSGPKIVIVMSMKKIIIQVCVGAMADEMCHNVYNTYVYDMMRHVVISTNHELITEDPMKWGFTLKRRSPWLSYGRLHTPWTPSLELYFGGFSFSVPPEGICENIIFGWKSSPFPPWYQGNKVLSHIPFGGSGRRETFREVGSGHEIVHMKVICRDFR